jgi:hypothetical protein
MIEYVDLPVRDSKPALRTGLKPEDDPRWESRWTGRKNFKKFTPQTTGAARRSDRATKVIVPLVPVKKGKTGLGDEYWEKSMEDIEIEKTRKAKQKEKSQRTTQSSSSRGRTQSNSQSRQTAQLTQTEVISSDVEDDSTEQTSPAAKRLQEEAATILDHELDLSSPRRTRGDDARSQTQRQQSQAAKRPAPKSKTQPAKKRQKTLEVTVLHGMDSEEEEEDDMKFKFGGRRKARG